MQTIGRYELIEKLGQGGMGAVYRARDTLLERIVAVKVIATSIDQNTELRERFLREARAAGPLSRSNRMMGTINYMAPEQIRGEKIDHRADIFSTAVVVYELLSGKRAFEADSFAATLYKILQEFPEPLQQIDPTIPTELVRIVERALSKPRDERYQHMSEMLLDLSLFRQQLAGMDSPAGGRLAPTELRTPSDQPFQMTPPIPLPPVATPLPVTGMPTPGGGMPVPASGPPASSPPAPSGIRSYLLPAIAVLALAIAAIAMWNSRNVATPPSAPVTTPPAPATPIAEVMKSALTA